VVGSVLGAKAKGDADEWMYELNAGGKLESDLATLKAAYQQLLAQPTAVAHVKDKVATIETQSLTGVARMKLLLGEGELALGLYFQSLL
jgi:hypothetical protein